MLSERPPSGGRSGFQPPLTRSSAPSGGVGSSTRSSQPSGRCTARGPLVWPRAARSALGRISRVGSSRSTTASQVVHRVHQRGPLPQLAPRGVAGEVPAGVLAEALHALPLALPLGQPGGVVAHHLGDDAERRRGLHGPAGEGVGEVAEQPRAAEAATADHDAVASGLGHHRQRVVGLPDVSVAQHRDGGDVGLQRGDRLPPGRAAVELLGRAGVQRDGGRALLLGDLACAEIGEQLVVHAHAELHRDRHGARGRDRRAHDGAQEGLTDREGRAASLAGDLRDRAAEVHVDVVDAVLVDEEPHRLAERAGVSAVELHRPGGLGAVEAEHRQRAGVALHEGARRDHLRDVEPRAELRAEPAEGGVGDAGHRGQHDGRVDRQRTDPEQAVDAHRHSSTIGMPMSARSRRRSGSDRPSTVPWSPSMPSTKGAA